MSFRKNWYLQNLLCPEELIDNGGKGVSMLMNCSMNNILVRWSFMMLRITLDKLRPIIEILEDQLVEKDHKKKHTRMEWLLPTDPYKPVRKPSSSGSSSDCEKDFFKLK